MSQTRLNLLDKGALGLALFRTDTDPFEDQWAIFGGKFFISISMATHLMLFAKEVLKYEMPSSRVLGTIIVLAVATLFYLPIRMATHGPSTIQQIRLSQRTRWLYQAWGLFLCPVSLLLWIPLFFVL